MDGREGAYPLTTAKPDEALYVTEQRRKERMRLHLANGCHFGKAVWIPESKGPLRDV